MVGRLIRCVARFAILEVGVIETDAAPGTGDMAARALPRPVAAGGFVAGFAVVGIDVRERGRIPVENRVAI